MSNSERRPQDPPSAYPPYNPVEDVYSKLRFAFAFLAVMLFLKYLGF